MDDSLVIYSSVFLLISFVFLYKYLGQSILLSLGAPLVLIILYNLNISSNFELPSMSGGGDINFEVMTDMPDF